MGAGGRRAAHRWSCAVLCCAHLFTSSLVPCLGPHAPTCPLPAPAARPVLHHPPDHPRAGPRAVAGGGRHQGAAARGRLARARRNVHGACAVKMATWQLPSLDMGVLGTPHAARARHRSQCRDSRPSPGCVPAAAGLVCRDAAPEPHAATEAAALLAAAAGCLQCCSGAWGGRRAARQSCHDRQVRAGLAMSFSAAAPPPSPGAGWHGLLPNACPCTLHGPLAQQRNVVIPLRPHPPPPSAGITCPATAPCATN